MNLRPYAVSKKRWFEFPIRGADCSEVSLPPPLASRHGADLHPDWQVHGTARNVWFPALMQLIRCELDQDGDPLTSGVAEQLGRLPHA